MNGLVRYDQHDCSADQYYLICDITDTVIFIGGKYAAPHNALVRGYSYSIRNSLPDFRLLQVFVLVVISGSKRFFIK